MGDNAVGPVTGQLGFHSVEPTSTREGPANATKGSGDNIRTIFPSPLFSTADDIVKKLGAPKVQVPPAVLLEEGRIGVHVFLIIVVVDFTAHVVEELPHERNAALAESGLSDDGARLVLRVG